MTIDNRDIDVIYQFIKDYMDDEYVEIGDSLIAIISSKFNLNRDQAREIVSSWANIHPDIEYDPLYCNGVGLIKKTD